MTQLTFFDALPDGFLEIDACDIRQITPNPSVIHLQGAKDEALFVSVLLHGNETSGLKAVQQLLKQYRGKPLPRSLILFIGNVKAAEKNLRRLAGQMDYNRIWKGGDAPEHRMAEALLAYLAKHTLFAAIDIHNNSGSNPYYACINRLEAKHIALAHLFGEGIVYFTKPDQVLSIACTDFCPTITIEAGQAGDLLGVARVAEFLGNCIELAAFKALPPDKQPVIFHTFARLTIERNVDFTFAPNHQHGSLQFIEDLEHLNFQACEAGTKIATRYGDPVTISATDDQGNDIGHNLFEYKDNGDICFALYVIPSMFAKNEEVIRLDCLGYVMEEISV